MFTLVGLWSPGRREGGREGGRDSLQAPVTVVYTPSPSDSPSTGAGGRSRQESAVTTSRREVWRLTGQAERTAEVGTPNGR